ncbi:ABC transporter permease [Caproiciproducens sp. LBM24188]
MAGNDVTFFDSRQMIAQTTQAFLTVAVFVYGFVLVIALISILNIINTMQTSVSAKTRYIGVMRAVGMLDKQLHKMILSEAGTYGVTGGFAGVLLGVALQRFLITKLLAGAHMTWQIPTMQAILIFILILFVLLSVIGPLKKIQSKGISETIGSLQQHVIQDFYNRKIIFLC